LNNNIKNKNIVKRDALSKYVVTHLIDCVKNGIYKPEDRIIELEIAKKLRVSQGVVREAIRELVALGFVKIEPFKGAHIKKITINEMKDYYMARAEIEVIGVKWAIKRISSKELNYLEELINKMINCANQHDYLNQAEIDLEFHRTIIHISGNKYLMKAWKALGVKYWCYIGVSLRKLDLKEQVVRHQNIYKSILKKDLKGAKKIIKEHFYEINIQLTDKID